MSGSTGTPSLVNLLRIWIGLVGIIAFGNTIMCFVSPKNIFDRMYTENVSGLTGRLFGVWTLLSGSLRLMCALDVYNKTLYHLTLLSFILALGHFLSEVTVYGTTVIDKAGVLSPLMVSSLSIMLMLIGYLYIGEEDPRAKYEDENEQLVGKAKKVK